VYSNCFLGKMSCEGPSAELSEVDTHTVEIHRSASWMILTISRKIRFCCVPRDLPAFSAPMTPWLSEA
jgi:hypothetical protein